MDISIIINKIEDPRREHGKSHSLENIIYIALAAVIGGAEGWNEIEDFGKSHIDYFKSKLEGLESIPSHDTFNRVFSLIDPEKFEQGFRAWVQNLCGKYKGVIAIDGKEICGAKIENKDGSVSPLRMVSAWAVGCGLVLGQEKVSEKSNEIKAIPELLKILDLKDCVVTIDAIGCQHKIVEQITSEGGDYLISVKENQRKLHDKIESFFSGITLEGNKKEGRGHIPPTRYAYSIQENVGHGRSEKRICRVLSYGDSTANLLDWEGVRSMACIENSRTNLKTNKTTTEYHYYITSLNKDPERILNVARQHWSIENNLHWQLDVSFNEDNQRKKRNAAQNISLVNKLSLTLLKQDTSTGSIKSKRKRAGWDNEFLTTLLSLV